MTSRVFSGAWLMKCTRHDSCTLMYPDRSRRGENVRYVPTYVHDVLLRCWSSYGQRIESPMGHLYDAGGDRDLTFSSRRIAR